MSDPLRFFVPPDTLGEETVCITGDVFHHLRSVLRAQPGDEALLLDGDGLCCRVRLDRIGKEEVLASVLDRWHEQEQLLPVTLIQGLPKGDKFDLILQKGTELGIARFVPALTEHTVSRPPENRRDKLMARWDRILGEAARQSRRPVRPTLAGIRPLDEALAEPDGQLRLVLWEAGARALADALPAERPLGVTLLVGPEGGFSDQEMQKIITAGFRPVHLGPRILRSETAGLAAAPVLQYLYGDWQCAPRHGNPNPSEEPS